MNSLDQAIETLRAGRGSGPKQRSEALAALESLAADCERARRVWQEYLDSPGAAGDAFSLVTWMGAARVKLLHEIHLGARERALRICELADPKLARLVLLEDDVIEMAFRGLRPGETGPDAARAAIEILNGRIAHLRAQAGRLRSAPERAAAKKTAARPAAGVLKTVAARGAKKPAARPSAKKAKPAARKAKKGKK